MATWHRTAGDPTLHAFDRPTDEADWWRTARCGKGPAVGDDPGSDQLRRCEACQAAEETPTDG